MELSVIIVNYNVQVFLESCLTSVRKALDGIHGEIIVVDNASNDASVEMVRRKFPEVILMENTRNVGFGVANNQAAKEAKSGILFFLNPDTIVQENTFRVVLDYFNQTPGAGIVGCKVLNPDGTLQPACRRSFPTPWVAFTKIVGLSALFPSMPFFSKYNLTYRNPDETYEVDAVSGSCLAIRKNAFDQIGGFDEQFFMYGEDLDLCYRSKSSGWKIVYIHSTQIIHYKGESVRRSSINDVRVFYQAMHVFVKKHFRYGFLAGLFLRGGILIREWIALIHKHWGILGAMVFDYFFVVGAWFIAEWLRFGEVFHFPKQAYPVMLIVPPLVVISSMLMFDSYTARKHSNTRTLNAVATAFMIIAALTFFFNEYAFSRLVLLIAGMLSALFLSLWREIARARRQSAIFARRTLIVGAGEKGIELVSRLRNKNIHGYEIVGFVDSDKKRIGEKVSGIEILGGIDAIGNVVQQHRISDVIFSSDSLSYAQILSVIGERVDKTVNYRLAPGNLEVIIGKTHIDELNDLPLVDIEYNVSRLSNRIVKRCMDIVVGGLLLMFIYPFIRSRSPLSVQAKIIDLFKNIPKVMNGKMSLIGYLEIHNGSPGKLSGFMGKPGVTGLAQVNNFGKLSEDEIAQYNMYYAKNQSLMLDLEILVKTCILVLKENRDK